jgi:hypothetical protein
VHRPTRKPSASFDVDKLGGNDGYADRERERESGGDKGADARKKEADADSREKEVDPDARKNEIAMRAVARFASARQERGYERQGSTEAQSRWQNAFRKIKRANKSAAAVSWSYRAPIPALASPRPEPQLQPQLQP